MQTGQKKIEETRKEQAREINYLFIFQKYQSNPNIKLNIMFIYE